jgi:hypothetical protein
MFILRTNDQSGLSIDENVNDAAVAAQKAHLIDELLAPAAKLDPMASACDRLAALRMTRKGSKSPCARIFSRVSAVEKQTRSCSGSVRAAALEAR